MKTIRLQTRNYINKDGSKRPAWLIDTTEFGYLSWEDQENLLREISKKCGGKNFKTHNQGRTYLFFFRKDIAEAIVALINKYS